MVRARCKNADAGLPPGSTNDSSGASSSFMRSISDSSQATCASVARKRIFLARGGCRHAKIGADIEEIVLDASERFVVAACGMQSRQADRGIGFIDFAIGSDAQVILRHTRAIAERSLSAVASARVNLRQLYQVSPTTLTSPCARPSDRRIRPAEINIRGSPSGTILFGRTYTEMGPYGYLSIPNDAESNCL